MKNYKNILTTWINQLSCSYDKESIYIKKGLIYIEDFLYYDIYNEKHLEHAKDVLNRINDKELTEIFENDYKRLFDK